MVTIKDIKTVKISFNGKEKEYWVMKHVPDELIEYFIEQFGKSLWEREIYRSVDDYDFVWCLVGNIVEEHEFGEEKEIRKGTKQFPPNAKVYCFPAQWGDGYEHILVLGKPRKRREMIRVVMPSKYITNWRVQKVYDYTVISEMVNYPGWKNTDADKEEIEKYVKFLTERTK